MAKVQAKKAVKAPLAKVEQQAKLVQQANKLYFEVFKDARNEYRWRIQAGNGKNMAGSSEGYVDLDNAKRAVDELNRADWPLKVEFVKVVD